MGVDLFKCRLALLIALLAATFMIGADFALAKPKEFPLPGAQNPLKKARPVTFLKSEVGAVFLGGDPPEIVRVDLTGKEKFVGKRIGYFYGLQLIIDRASGDKQKGEGTIYRAPGRGRWRDAIKALSGTDPSFVDLVPGNVLQRRLNKRFPPIKLEYSYKILINKPPTLIGRVTSSLYSGRLKGSFFQSLPPIFPAGPQWIGVESCVDMAPHPLKTAKSVAKFVSLLNNIWRTIGWVRFAGPHGLGFAAAEIAAKQAGFQAALDSKRTCTRTYHKIVVPAIVPKLLGMGRIPAHKEIRKRKLKVEVVAPRQCSAKLLRKLGTRRVVSQSPKPGRTLDPGGVVKVRYCAPKTKTGGVKPPSAPAAIPIEGQWNFFGGILDIRRTGAGSFEARLTKRYPLACTLPTGKVEAELTRVKGSPNEYTGRLHFYQIAAAGQDCPDLGWVEDAKWVFKCNEATVSSSSGRFRPLGMTRVQERKC